SSANGGDWVVKSFHDDGWSVAGFPTITWNSGGTNNDRLNAINVKAESITAIGDNGSDLVMRRYDADTQLDTTWGTNGQITWDSGTGLDSGRAVTNEYWGDMFIAGTQASNGGDMWVRKYNYAGELADTTGGGTVRVVGMPGSDRAHFTGDVSVGAAADTGTTVLDMNTNDKPWDFDGDLTVSTKGALRASNSSPWSLAGNLAVAGTFYGNGGTLSLDDARRPSTISGGATLGIPNLRIARADKQVALATGTQLNVTGSLAVDGGSCTSPVRLTSTAPGTRAKLNVTGTSSTANVRMQDIDAVAPLTVSNAVNGGNNLNVTFGSACAAQQAAPTALFVGDTSASTGTRHRPISAALPTFSWLAPSGATYTSQRMQVWSTPPSDATALWHLDGAGTDAGTGTAAPVTLSASPQDPAYVAGQTRFGQALDFDGDDRASAPVSSKLDLGTLTVDLWMQSSQLPAASSGIATLVGKDGTFAIKAKNDGELHGQVRVGGVWQDAYWPGASIFDGAWHHVAVTANPAAGKVTLSVDGRKVAIATFSGAIDRPSATTWLGDDGSGTSYFRGRLDDLRVSATDFDEGDLRGVYRARQPHATVLWDSSSGGAGVAMASCTGPARCADITYGGGSSDLLIDGARYYARAMYKDTVGTWTPWSDTDWFEMAHAMSISLPGGVVSSLGTSLPGTDTVGQFDVQVTSNAAHGYSLLATTATDAWGMSSGVDTVARYNNPIADTPTAWTPGAALGFGVTVLSAPGRSSARWGLGTNATDVGTLNYAGVSLSSPVTLASTSSGTGALDTTRVGLRTNAALATKPGSYSTTIALTVVPNP
ncbi:MAG: uncharacterized protein JWL76_2260, partial [Thermoleophilia bacterium]|nr:uncharacterized protein [Thermoleophilia bacterium]